MCTCMNESLYCTPETNTTLKINYTLTKSNLNKISKMKSFIAFPTSYKLPKS